MIKTTKLPVRILSVILSILLLIGTAPLNAFAFNSTEGSVCSSRLGEKYIGSDGEPYGAPKDFDYLTYNADGSTVVRHKEGHNFLWHFLLTDSAGEDRYVYCVEAGVDFEESTNEYISSSGTNSRYYQNLPYAAQFGIMLCTVYGWTDGKAFPIDGINTDDYMVATQVIIWEYQQGLRTSPAVRINNGTVLADTFYNSIKNRPAELAYNWILNQMSKHYIIPSFTSRNEATAPNMTLRWDQSANKYTVTVTDTNGTLADIKLDNSNIQITRSGNKYTFSSSKEITSAALVKCRKNVAVSGGQFLIWGRPGYQTMVCGAEDPVFFFFKIQTEADGICRIKKTSEDGKISGVKFTITGNGANIAAATGVGGTADITLKPGIYTVTEQTADRYNPQNTQRVTVVSGQIAPVNFNNTLKRGDLTVTKTSEDGLNEGVKFHLYGTSLSGLTVDEYAVTDSSGKAYFKNVLIGTGYTLEEVDTAIRYVVPDKQTAAVEWNKVTNKTFNNILKKWNVTVTKSDRETGTAQGDATLSGAVYGIYKGEQLIDTYTTDENGQFTTKYYVCGDDWSVREIIPSEGYLLDESAHHIGAESRNYTVEYNSTSNDVLETIIKGKITLIKHTNDGSTQLETPEVGAEFEVFLKKTGSYENSENTERDIIVCDKNGFAQTKDLPYGIYTVHQIKGWDGREFLPDFDAYIRENGQIYRYLANNANFESYIKIIKTDAESGCVIPYAGAAFKLYDPDGNKIVMSYTYPEYTEIDTFYTTGDGMLIAPQKLKYGKGYSLVEVSAPYGYVLDSTPIYFDVAADTATEDGAITVVKVSRPNMPQKGIIKINKSGEVFSSVMESEGIYQPVYTVQGLPGAVYEITAAEDIITPDGTLRYAVGEVVDTVTTDETGLAVSRPLYLGKYKIREITAPYGTVLNTEIHTAELVYAGQEIEIIEISAGFCNERQKAAVSLEKIMEQDELFGIGQNNEIRSVQFGLFAAEDLTATDGSIIPADGLLEAIYCTENGEACFTTDLPVGANCYVREIATDCSYVLFDEKYPIVFEYAGQDTALVEIKANDGNVITNEILRGTVKGMKTDRETEEVIEGALFGLFASNETEYNENTALLTAASDENGVFSFEDIPFGSWIIKELQPADGYLPNDEVYTVEITEHGQLIGISVVNDKIPEIETKASVDGEKEICATEVFTLKDTVSYRHLIPGKEYTVSGVLMNKTTKVPLIIDGAEIRSETILIPDDPTGETTVSFTFDSKYIKEDTDIVVFESLSCEGAILTSHEDIDDPDQTITVCIPKICTYASAYGRKDVMSDSCVAIDDTVSYVNLTPGKEYTVKGILMDKSTRKPFLENGKEICSEIVFIPNTSNGYITASFVLDAKQVTDTTEIVVFETLYRNGVEIASHTDIEDMEQTVTVKKPPIEIPQTGDNSHLLLWSALTAVSGAILVFIGVYRKNFINKKTRKEK